MLDTARTLGLMLVVLATTANAQVQDNSPDASLFVNGRAQDGYLGAPPLDVVPGGFAQFEITSEPFRPVLLAFGLAAEPGVPYASSTLNLGHVQVLLNGLAGGLGQFAITGPDGVFSIGFSMPSDLPTDTTFAFQAAVLSAPHQPPQLTAPTQLRLRPPTLLYTVNAGAPHVLYGSTPLGTSQVDYSPLEPNLSVRLGDYALSPDRTLMAYVSDQNFATLEQLFITAATGMTDGNTVQITPTVSPVSDVLDIAWSPDSSRIAFLHDADTDDRYELYIATPDGSSVIKVNDELPFGGDVATFAWSPDGKWLAYQADALTLNRNELFTVRPDGTDNVLVSEAQLDDGVLSYAWSPSGDSLAYIGHEMHGRQELFITTPGAEPSLKLNGPIQDDIFEFAWAPDGSRLAYRGEVNSPSRVELYSVKPDGSAHTRISDEDMLDVNGDIHSFTWSPDSQLIAFLGDMRFGNINEIFVADAEPLPDSAIVVSGFMPPQGEAFAPAWAPDGSRLAYISDQLLDGRYELFTADPAGGGVTVMNGPMVNFGDDVQQFAWSPASDEIRLAYEANEDATGSGAELYIIDGDGHNRVKASGDVHNIDSDIRWDPSGYWIAFEYDDDLYINSRDGTEFTTLKGPEDSDRVMEFSWERSPE